MAGRGFGKTRCGAEWVLSRVAAGARRIHLVGATAADVRDTMIEGESGLLACAPADNRPVYIASKRLVRWPNGARGLCFSAEQPRQLRGPQCDTAWADELAAWEKPETWDQLLFGLRLGSDPRVCVTTTPRPTKLVKRLVADRTTAVTRGSTYDNAANLAPQFIADILAVFEGTRLGRQELEAEILDDTPGALWTTAQLDGLRADGPDELTRIAVAVDPSATSSETSAETGIVAAGADARGEAIVLCDRSGKYSPGEWGEVAVLLHDELGALCIVIETNQGGDMAEHVLVTAAEKLYREKKRPTPHLVVVRVHASTGKRARAEPVSALYEQGRVRHRGVLAKLEDQMTTWDASDGKPSPDRIDALVWCLWWLLLEHTAPAGYRGASKSWKATAPKPAEEDRTERRERRSRSDRW